MTKFIYAALLASIGSIIVHICVLFLVPYYEQNNIWTWREKEGKFYRFVDLNPNDPIRQSTDPLFLLKICKFDLENGPVHLTTPKTTQFWSLSAYTRDGIIFYSINDRTTPNATLNLIIGNPIQITALKQSTTKSSTNSVLVTKKLNEGFALLRIFAPSPIARKEGETFLSNATCRVFDE
ncbi:DUF1254 domain-containing protein [Bartonella sp. A05]|uniref:DUF1254 domain-containing protein n=1 Tax=Bartonella sp. A05 TaxID=2967261 RepID=UPI0022A9B3B2|nr:hypothetical protein [Bartonella sp. A05]MCZ2203856.1 hypothetical protein [Bartonella sp. A05]